MITESDLERVIARSEQFDDELFSMFQEFEVGDNRSYAVVTMCNIAHEHAISLRNSFTHIRHGYATSSIRGSCQGNMGSLCCIRRCNRQASGAANT